MHMTERHIHHLPYDLYRVAGLFLQAKSDNNVYSFCMSFVADIMAVDASCLAHFLLMAYAAFHLQVLVEVFERCFADKAFFFHNGLFDKYI